MVRGALRSSCHTPPSSGGSFAHSPWGPNWREESRAGAPANIAGREDVLHRRIGVRRHSAASGRATVIAARTKFVFEVLFEPNLYPRNNVSGTLSNTYTSPPPMPSSMQSRNDWNLGIDR